MKTLRKNSSAAAHAGKALLLASGLLLSGCVMDGAAIDDSYVAGNHEVRYPIRVAEAPVKMNVDGRSGTLGANQMNSVIGFAQDARNTASSRISVRYASGSSSARAVARQTVEVLAGQGVPRGRISTGSHRGSGAMVTLSFLRKVAVTTECGDWSENLAGNQYNEPYPNQGCALQQNIAAMVANPEDFETPHPMAPATAASRSAAMVKYNKGEATSAESGSSSAAGASSSALAN